MRFPISKPVLLAYLVILAGVSACGTTGRGPDATSSSATTLRGEYQALRDQIETTMQALDEVTGSGDVASQEMYAGFSSAVLNLENQSQRVQNASATMRTTAEAYIQSWSEQTAEIQNEEIRGLAEGRRAQAQERIDTTNSGLELARANYDALQSDLEDISSFLGLDPAGLAALADEIQVARELATTVLSEIDQIIAQLDLMIEGFSALGSDEGRDQ